MTMKREATAAACLLALLLGVRGAPAGELPANTWTPAGEKKGGIIAGMVYLPAQKGMLLFGYPPPKSSCSDLDLYLPAERKWTEPLPGRGPHRSRGSLTAVFKNGRPGLPCINRPYWLANQCCYLPAVKKVLYFAGGLTFTYDPSAKKWEDLKIPLDASPPDVMLGTIAWDPAEKRAVLFGGGYISAHKRRAAYIKGDTITGKPWTREKWNAAEKRATWAFDPGKRAWSRVITGSEEFRALNLRCLAFEPRCTALIAAVRGIALEYADTVTGKKPSGTAASIDKLTADAKSLAGKLAAGGGCKDAYEAGQCKLAAAELEKAAASLKAAGSATKASDGWRALRAAEKARWELFEAAEAISPSPLPRYYACMVTDTKNKLLVLFGGHGGNRALADTWVFDGAKDQWRRSKSKAHPPFTSRPAMSFDPKHGLVFLSTGWIYDAAGDEWKKLAVKSPKKYFSGWTALEHDPVSGLHVTMTTGSNMFGVHPRKTALLRLDPAAARAAPGGGPVWKWLNDKYEKAWARLPADQAGYKALVAEQKKFLDGLEPNVWAKRIAPYNAQDRSYGSFCYDPERDQIVFWGGGHSAYMGNEFSHYDVKSNRWMESWAPDLPPWPFGRPDGDGWNPAMYHKKGSAHGYHHYVYNADLKKVVFYGGAVIYDPDRMRWTDLGVRQQGKGSRGATVDMSGAAGLLTASARYYRGAPFGVWKADLKGMTISRLAGSDPPFGSNDRAKAVYDSRRKRILWYGVKSGKNRRCDELWAFPLEKGKWEKLAPTMDPPGAKIPQMGSWGNCYSPKHDVMVILPGGGKQDTWVYDCAKNVLRKAFPGPKTNRWGTNGAVYNAKRDVFMTIDTGSYGTGPVCVHFLRYRAK